MLGLIFQKRIKLGKALRLLTLLFAFVAAAVLAEAAHLGGQIRHSEIRKNDQPQGKAATNPGETNAPRKGDD